MKELLSPQDLTQASITKDATHLYINFVDDDGLDHTIKIPLIKSKPNSSFNTETKVQSVKPSIVRIDRTETGQQIEFRSPEKKSFQRSTDIVPFTRKLTESQVREIKALLADKEYMHEFPSEYKAHKELGAVYGVHYMTIKMIARGITWKHIK